MTVINLDSSGRVIEDISKVVIHLDEFQEVTREVQRIYQSKKEAASA